jgi:hypothetical protein
MAHPALFLWQSRRVSSGARRIPPASCSRRTRKFSPHKQRDRPLRSGPSALACPLGHKAYQSKGHQVYYVQCLSNGLAIPPRGGAGSECSTAGVGMASDRVSIAIGHGGTTCRGRHYRTRSGSQAGPPYARKCHGRPRLRCYSEAKPVEVRKWVKQQAHRVSRRDRASVKVNG